MISGVDAVGERCAEIRDGQWTWHIVRAEELRGVKKGRDLVHPVPMLDCQ
jgi:hypothetical protein